MVTLASVPPVTLGRETTALQFSHLPLGSLLNFNETAIKIIFISYKVTYTSCNLYILCEQECIHKYKGICPNPKIQEVGNVYTERVCLCFSFKSFKGKA